MDMIKHSTATGYLTANDFKSMLNVPRMYHHSGPKSFVEHQLIRQETLQMQKSMRLSKGSSAFHPKTSIASSNQSRMSRTPNFIDSIFVKDHRRVQDILG